MKIERISYNRIKVTLSVDDLERWNLSVDSLSHNSPEAQEMFWDMMRKAEDETGFSVHDSKLIIEATPSKSGGFTIFVTRVDANEELESIQKYIKSRFKKTELKVKKKTQKPDSLYSIYTFDNFEDVCLASARIKDLYKGESSLYKYKGIYYLELIYNKPSSKSTIDVDTNTSNNLESVTAILCEYGNRNSNYSITKGFLNEYGDLIVENTAIETLYKHFI